MSGPQIAYNLLPQQIILFSVPVEDLISSWFFSYSGSFEISSQFSLSIIELSYCRNGQETEDESSVCLSVLPSTTSPCWYLFPWIPEPAARRTWPSSSYWPLHRALMPGDRDAFQPAAAEHLTLTVSSGLWIRKGLCPQPQRLEPCKWLTTVQNVQNLMFIYPCVFCPTSASLGLCLESPQRTKTGCTSPAVFLIDHNRCFTTLSAA